MPQPAAASSRETAIPAEQVPAEPPMTASAAALPAVSEIAGVSMPTAHDLRGVLRLPAFRQLWIALSVSSLGDWLGLLATTALASSLAGSYAGQSFAIGGVLIFRLLPAVLLGPVAGAFADRFDRRRTMVVCDCLRFLLFVSIPLVGTLPWLLVATFLIESVSLFWIPAKEASVPNLVPRERLEAANRLSLVTTYGSAAPAAGVFSLLALLNGVLAAALPWFRTNPVSLALYFDAVTFLFSAVTIFRLKEIQTGRGGPRVRSSASGSALSFWRSITEGWAFVGQTPVVRGLVIGILGAFTSGGAIIATGKQFSTSLGGGNAAYGVLFGAVFLGMALGMFLGPRLLGEFSRRRLFGLAIVAAGGSVSVLALLPEIVLVSLLTVAVGAFAGVGWVTGYTLLGLEVADAVRGRTFALLQSLVRIDLLLTLAAVPFVVGLIGRHQLQIGNVTIRLDGVTVTLFAAGLIAVAVGLLSYRLMDDRHDVPLLADLLGNIRGEPVVRHRRQHVGVFLAIEGGEGAGKSTQVRLLADWLRAAGHEVVVTREPGATELGARVRALLLDPASGPLSPRAEALLYAADRAEHVTRVIGPALAGGAIVLTDRYVDSSLAYQSAGRALPASEVAWLSRWATSGLVPDLTVVLDVDPEVGLTRITARRGTDRIEAEAAEFHRRVRDAFRALAEADRRHHLLVPAAGPPAEVQARLRARVGQLLGDRAGDGHRRRRPFRVGHSQPNSSPESAGTTDPVGRWGR